MCTVYVLGLLLHTRFESPSSWIIEIRLCIDLLDQFPPEAAQFGLSHVLLHYVLHCLTIYHSSIHVICSLVTNAHGHYTVLFEITRDGMQ